MWVSMSEDSQIAPPSQWAQTQITASKSPSFTTEGKQSKALGIILTRIEMVIYE